MLKDVDNPDALQALGADMGDAFDETTHQFKVTGTADSDANAYDQATFYFKFPDTAKASSVLVVPVHDEGWTAAQLADYIALRLGALTNIHLVDASDDTLLGSVRVESVRRAPDGGSQVSVLRGAKFRRDDQYRPDILDIPIRGGLNLDGYTGVRILTGASSDPVGSPRSYTALMTLSLAVDPRGAIPRVAGKVTVAPR